MVLTESNHGSAYQGRGGKTVEEIYQKKTQLEHILLRPDTYVGSIEQSTQPMWVLDASTKRIVRRPVTSFAARTFRRRVAATPRGATWIFRGDESRRRRGRDADILWRRVAVMPRVPRG